MLTLSEEIILREMLKNKGTTNLKKIIKFMGARYLSIEEWSIRNGKDPLWVFDIRKSHHLLKDKGLITGGEFETWRLTDKGYAAIDTFKKPLNKGLLIHIDANHANDIYTGLIAFRLGENPKIQALLELTPPYNGYIFNAAISLRTKIRVKELNITDKELLIHFDSWSTIVDTLIWDSFPEIEPGGFYIFDDSSLLLGNSDFDNTTNLLNKKQTTSNKRDRDTQLSARLKSLYDNYCQICGTRISLGHQVYYSEAHHLIPIGEPHNGPDTESNMIVLCPNHHVEFDSVAISINPDSQLIEHIDPSSVINGNRLKINLHKLSSECLNYHYNRFIENKRNGL